MNTAALVERIAHTIIPVFLIVAVGWGYGRRHRPDMSLIGRLALDVFSPALVFASFTRSDFDLGAELRLIAAAVCLLLGCGAVAWIAARALGVRAETRATLMVASMFNNTGNMGLPLALLAFGPQGLPAAVAIFVAGNLLHFTLGVKLLAPRASLAHLLWSPLNLALLLGLASAASGIRPPEPINQGLRMLGEGMLPLMLFALGVRLNDLNLSGLRIGLAGALLRPLSGLLVAPLVVAAFGLVAPLSAEARAQLFLYAALPPAVLNFMLADRYGHEPQMMAAIVLAGNALALLFVPIGLALGLSPTVGAWLGSP